MRKLNKVTASIAGGALVVATAGTAYAYWTSNGSGQGTAGTTAGVANIANLVSGNLPAISNLFPGQGAQGFNYTVANNSGQSIYVTTVKAYVTVAPVAANDSALDTDGCDSSDYKVDDAAGTSATSAKALDSWVAQDIATATSVVKGTSLQFVNKSAANQDDCKGAAVTVHYVAS